MRAPPPSAAARLLRLTPRALTTGPLDRAALFSVTEIMENLGRGFPIRAHSRPIMHSGLRPYHGPSARPQRTLGALVESGVRLHSGCRRSVGQRHRSRSADLGPCYWHPASRSSIATRDQPERRALSSTMARLGWAPGGEDHTSWNPATPRTLLTRSNITALAARWGDPTRDGQPHRQVTPRLIGQAQ